MPNQEEIKKSYAKFVAKVWSDERFRQRVLSDPATVLKESGFSVPEGKEVKIIETDMEKTVYFILPAKPVAPLSDINVEEAAIKHSFSENVKEGVPFSVYIGVTFRCQPCFM
jgi:Nitrile hydratase, alpha chain